MALTVDTNSYISRADAITYFSDRLNSAEWTDATDADKDASLIQATKIIDTITFTGKKYSSTQVLKFPRSQIYYDGYLLDATIVPQQVLDATCEFAIWLLQDDYTAPDDLMNFESVTLGPIEVQTKVSVSRNYPPMVTMLLSSFVDSSLRLVRG